MFLIVFNYCKYEKTNRLNGKKAVNYDSTKTQILVLTLSKIQLIVDDFEHFSLHLHPFLKIL